MTRISLSLQVIPTCFFTESRFSPRLVKIDLGAVVSVDPEAGSSDLVFTPILLMYILMRMSPLVRLIMQ